MQSREETIRTLIVGGRSYDVSDEVNAAWELPEVETKEQALVGAVKNAKKINNRLVNIKKGI